jgi:hypothetical protein
MMAVQGQRATDICFDRFRALKVSAVVGVEFYRTFQSVRVDDLVEEIWWSRLQVAVNFQLNKSHWQVAVINLSQLIYRMKKNL